VVHHYLHSAKKGFQTRLRKRMRNGRGTYTFTGQCECALVKIMKREFKKGLDAKIVGPTCPNICKSFLRYDLAPDSFRISYTVKKG
jgi:hypothetical protein